MIIVSSVCKCMCASGPDEGNWNQSLLVECSTPVMIAMYTVHSCTCNSSTSNKNGNYGLIFVSGTSWMGAFSCKNAPPTEVKLMDDLGYGIIIMR